MKLILPLIAIAVATVLSACKEDVADSTLPAPIALTEEAAGHYCQMVILEHQGPKAQIFLAGLEAPLWFSQVRDGLAYIKSPEQSHEILGLYVNDMAKANDWNEPGSNNWMLARDAFFVVGSDAIGGMGAPEIVPFGTETAALDFAMQRGGSVMSLKEVPVSAVLGPIELAGNSEESQ